MTTPSWVAAGPINGTGWYVIDAPPADCLAPGEVVLLHDATLTLHAEAQRRARDAWDALERLTGGRITKSSSVHHSGSDSAA